MIRVALLLALLQSGSAVAQATEGGRAPGRPLVVVDAGHGGPDRGMRGTTSARKAVHEADITLAIAKRLRDALEAREIDVLLTRSTDTLIALRDRGRIANDVGSACPPWPARFR